MRIRINLLSLLRTLLKVAGTVQTVAELILATQGQRGTDGGQLDLDAVRAGAGQPATSSPATPPAAYPADPSAAH